MWSLVAHQIENAELLAKEGPTRPRQAALRRAVSTAYYALFQALCELTASELVGWNKPWAAFTPVYRSFDHSHARTILSQIAVKPQFLETVEELGLAFKELQDKREWADYSPEPHPDPNKALAGARFSRQEAIELIELAKQAARSLDTLDKETRVSLAALLVSRRRKERAR